MSASAYDIAAEQSLLGLAMMFPDNCEAAFLTVESEDWWHWRHRELAAVMTGMFRSKQSVDPTLILGQVMAQGLISRIDGAWILSLAQQAWRPESAADLARRVRELSGRRKLSQAAQRLSQRLESGWENGEDTDVATAVAEIRTACDDAEAVVAEKSLPIPQSMGSFLDEPDTHDWLIPGMLERAERIVLTGAEGGGKALAIDTPVPTPKGWTTMGGLSVGDEVFHADGNPVRVIAATEVMLGRPCYRVTFSDGAQIVADEQHLWLTESLRGRENFARSGRKRSEVITTKQISETVQARDGFALNHSIEVSSPLRYSRQEYSIDPYALGVWLGDGTSRQAAITCDPRDIEIIDHIRATGEDVKQREPMLWAITNGDKSMPKGQTFQGRLRTLNVLSNKHIPSSYQLGSVDQRLALLQGLMDSDGTVSGGLGGNGRGLGQAKCEFSVISERLASDFLELALGLGIKAVMRTGNATLNGRVIGLRYRIAFQTNLPAFRLGRKLERQGECRTRRSQLRYVTSVGKMESVPVRCIQVERADGLFVVGRECIVTHNSVLCSQLAACMAGGVHPFTADPLGNGTHGIRVLVIDCENSPAQSRRRYRGVIRSVDAARHGNGYSQLDWSESMFIDMRPAGIDLLAGRDVSWLEHAISSTAPDLLVLGPLYKLHHQNPSDETAARELVWVLDGLRERYGFALLTEAHAGNSADPAGDRQMRPIGSSLFRRWPEFGFGLRRAKADKGKPRAELVDVVSWRGSREERSWPQSLQHSHILPWMPADPEYFDEIARIPA